MVDLMMTTKLNHLGDFELTNMTSTRASVLDRRCSRMQPAHDALFTTLGMTP